MPKFLILLIFSSSVFALQMSTIRSDIKRAKLVIVGEVLETNSGQHLIKLSQWTQTKVIKSNFVHIIADKELEKYRTYLFAINDLKGEKFWIENPKRDIYEIKSLGDYQYIIRNYNSDKPLIGQMSLSSMVNFIKKDLNKAISVRSLSRYEKEQITISKSGNSRSIASVKTASVVKSKTSVTWLISFLCFLVLIPFIFRKTRL